MQLKAEQLATQLERELCPLYVLYGDEPLLVLEAADAIRTRARARGFSEREVLTALTSFDWGQLALAGGNLSLFGERKLIDLRIPNGKPGRDGSAALQAYCQHLGTDVLLLITLPEIDWKEEKSAWFTALAQAGVAVKLNAPPLAELPGWIAGRLRRQQQSADADALAFIAERVEGNLLAAHQEVQKLGLLYPQGKLTLAQVREAVLNVARYDIDDLRGALLAGDLPRYCRTLDGLKQEGEPSLLALWAVAEEIRALAQIRQGLDRGLAIDALLREAKVWGPRVGPIKRAVQKHSTATLREALRESALVDRQIKGAAIGDPWEQLLHLACNLLGSNANRRRCA
jgi:DNA polymerase III subunit delta